MQRHLEGGEFRAAGLGHQLANHVLQDVDVVRAVADDKHQRNAADHTDGFAAPSRFVREMVRLGRVVELGAQDGVRHEDGHQRDTITKDDRTDQRGGDVFNLLKIGVLHTGDVTIPLIVGHLAAQERKGLPQDQKPHSDADVANIVDLPESSIAQRQDHGDEAVHTEAGHEINPGIGVDVKGKAGNLAQHLP